MSHLTFNIYHLRFKKWKLILFLILFFSSAIYYILNTTYSLAANAIPAPAPIDCSATPNPEFSSDRPYQASVCGDRPITYWCGNSVVINLGSVKTSYCDKQGGQLTECPCTGANCDHTDGNSQKIDVDLTNVQLPILGNTQLTKNSQSATDQIDDGTKTSNYVAWYLGGTNDKAEYPTDPATVEGMSKIIDTSGPLKKLLPSIIQDAARLDSIKAASPANAAAYTTDTENVQNATPVPVTENQTHNQIVVCASPNGLFGPVKPHDCYSGNGAPATDYYRLLDWYNGSLGLPRDISNLVVSALRLIPGVGNIVSTAWDKRYPPLPWSDENKQPFKTDIAYQKAYNEWQGKSCIIVPVVNALFCVDNPLVTNKWADLYQYVPLANTTDKKGSHMISNTHVTAPQATLESVSYVINHSPQLYLSHSLEDSQLATQLQNTFKPRVTSNAAASSIPNDVENNSLACRIIPSRTNPGDDATFQNPESYIDVDVSYKVTMIQCTDIHWVEGDFSNYTGKVGPGHWDANCSSDIYATVNTIGKFAYSDEIWNTTVAGPDSIFRRIYPKTGNGSPVTCIADTPAVSNATYTLKGDSIDQGLSLLRVQEPDKSSVKSEDGVTANAQLYYPHYGGVLDYFLNGIQQALRPQGYGPGQPTSGQYCTNIQCGELPNLPKASGSCNLSGISSKVGNIPQSLKDIVSAAAETYKVPPNLILGIMYGEGLFGGRNAKNWTDQNVKNWATCQKVPDCNETGDDNFMGFNGGDWATIAPHILPDLQKLDPTKKTADVCNLLDAVYGEAWNLHDSADGGYTLAGRTCFGIGLSASIPNSCTWNNNQYESAIKIAENGYDPGCLTLENSCFTGGGNGALCPGGGDTCETLTNRYANPSHNACVWDVGHGN